MEYLFVYGTLLSPIRERLNIPFPELTTYQNAHVHGLLLDLEHYPGLIFTSPEKVYGQLYTLPDNYSFSDLDSYEGFDPDNPSNCEFIRIKKNIFVNQVISTEAWVYAYNRNSVDLGIISGGNYLEFHTRKFNKKPDQSSDNPEIIFE